MAGVQFIGANSIIAAYQECGMEYFALFEGKQLLVRGCGIDDLKKWLTMIGESGTFQQYLLKMYSDDPGSEVSGTEPDACFRVQINDRGGSGYMGGVGMGVMQRLEKLEKEKAEAAAEDPLMDALLGWVEEPHKMAQAIGALKDLFGMASPQTQTAMAGTVLPDTQGKGTLIITPDKEAQYNRLAAALDTLEKVDPDIVSGIEKLAQIAKNKPDTYKNLRNMLNVY